MITRQKIKLNMYLAIRNFAVQNEKTANSIPKFPESYQQLLKLIQEIQSASELQGLNRKGLTIDKDKLKKSLVAIALKYSNIVSVFAKLNKNDTLYQEVKINESTFLRLPGVTVLEKATLVYNKTQENFEKLTEHGITADTQKKFLETITSFNNLLSTPRTGMADRRRETQKLKVLFANADEQVNIIDLAVASAKIEYPDFYNAYKTSRTLVDTSSGRLAVKASVKTAETGEPVAGATFIFKSETDMASGGNGNGEIVKKTAKKGSFQIKSMAPGAYKVLVNKEGYKAKELSVVITEGERSDMAVVLEKA